MEAAPEEITQLLINWRHGDKAALEQLMPLVYEALTNLATVDPRKSRIIEMRFFGGLNIDETAEVMELSATTVQREWRAAKAWLRRFIEGETFQNRER